MSVNSKREANLVVVSDLHCGCTLGLHPAKKSRLDEGGFYEPSKLQRIVTEWWDEFWNNWVPRATNNQPYTVVINGDTLDGVHHRATTQVSQNLSDQAKIARTLLEPIVDKCNGRFYMLRGTEAHVGPSGVEEERLAKELGAIPDSIGKHARNELWIEVGDWLTHIMHHIGTTGSTHYESSAVMKELAEGYSEAGRWNERAPDCIVRSHRHRYIKVEVPADGESNIAVVTPGWQLKTPFTYRIAGGRLTQPQFGGLLIRQGNEEAHERHKVWSLSRPKSEVV